MKVTSIWSSLFEVTLSSCGEMMLPLDAHLLNWPPIIRFCDPSLRKEKRNLSISLESTNSYLHHFCLFQWNLLKQCGSCFYPGLLPLPASSCHKLCEDIGLLLMHNTGSKMTTATSDRTSVQLMLNMESSSSLYLLCVLPSISLGNFPLKPNTTHWGLDFCASLHP